jgi:hypothetical protein
MNEVCAKCQFKKDCECGCPALNKLLAINRQQNREEKEALIKRLSRELAIQDAERSKELEELAGMVIDRFDEFSFIKEYGINIGYVMSYERKNGEKTVYADCRKISEVFKAYLPYDFIITFYDHHVGHMNDNQKKILMKHELKHVGVGIKGLKIVPHDIGDFKDILKSYGMEWDSYGKELPDILANEAKSQSKLKSKKGAE